MRIPDEALRERFNRLAGKSTAAIADALSDVDLETVTRELMAVCMERTDPSALYFLPFTVRHTLYGDDDIGDWIVRHDGEGAATIEPADEATAVDGHVRWERWEDVVRLVNDDVQPMSLFYSRRCIALGEGDFMRCGQKWVAATNFPGLPEEERFGWIIAHVRSGVDDRSRMDEVIERFGFDRIVFARANLMAHTMADLRANEVLADSWLRWEVHGHDVVSQVDFADDGDYTVRMLTRAEADREPPDRGVTIWFASEHDFLQTAGGKESLPGLLVQGTAKLLGTDERREAYNAATRRMYAPGATSG